MRLDPGAARRLFGAAPVARLATVSPAGRPHLVPVTFVLDRQPGQPDHVYTAVDAKPKTTTRLQRLRNIQAHPQVALLADHYSADWTRLWWVRADGQAAVLDAAAGAAELARPAAPARGALPAVRRAAPGGPGHRDPGGPVDRLGRDGVRTPAGRRAAAQRVLQRLPRAARSR